MRDTYLFHVERIAAIVLIAAATLVHANPLTPEQQSLVDRAKALIVDDLKDPGSVQWRDLYATHNDPWPPALCGWVNARNGFGGYAGFRPFYSVPHYKLAQIRGEHGSDQTYNYYVDVAWSNASDRYCAAEAGRTPIDP